MTELLKYGIHKKESFNIPYKLILIILNSVVKEIISFVEVLKKQLIFGNVVFMIL